MVNFKGFNGSTIKVKKTPYGYSASTAKTVAKLAKDVKKIKRDFTPEVKSLFNRSAASYVDWNGRIDELSLIPSSIDDEGKIGDKVRGKYLYFSTSIYTSTSAPSSLRMIIYKDHQNDITFPIEILRYAGTYSAINSQYAQNTEKNFTVLMDRTFVVNTNVNGIINFKRNIKVDFPIYFLDGVTTNRNNSIKVLFISDVDDGLASTYKPLITYAAELKYTDA